MSDHDSHFHPPIEIRFEMVGEEHDIRVTFLNNKDTFPDDNGMKEYVPDETVLLFHKNTQDPREGMAGLGVASMLQALLDRRDHALVPYAEEFRAKEPQRFQESLDAANERAAQQKAEALAEILSQSAPPVEVIRERLGLNEHVKGTRKDNEDGGLYL